MKNKYKKLAFSLLELVVAMTIFTIIAMSLYSLFDVLTAFQTESLGINNFKKQGFQIIETLSEELSKTINNKYYVYPVGNIDTTSTIKTPLSFQFKAFECGKGDAIEYANAKAESYQINFSCFDFDTPSVTNIEDFIKYGNNNVFWENTRIKEKTIFLNTDNELRMAVKTEKTATGESNDVDGIADKTGSLLTSIATDDRILGKNVENIKYFFWDDNIDWSNDNVSANPITEWNSTVLPKAIKVVLTMRYNSYMYHVGSDAYTAMTAAEKTKYDLKDQLFVFEKIIFFTERRY